MAKDNANPTLESMLEFQKVYLRAIALSWRNHQFKDELLEKPLETLAKYFGYQCPWIIDIEIVKTDGDHGWTEHRDGSATWNLPRNVMTVGIPEQPKDPDEEAVALAAYCDAGASYLFTCC
ncbi:BMA_0021/BMA_0022 family TOMM bacteriocin [Burkholderia sp. LMG 32019]|uniref:BMA_0021/BMA_0022 family TOMM bacteriocin n=1 Tax=Burkholderia sp. LMG 32019 TaxID=3158173 RepID=UPI003C307D1B